MSRSFYGRTGVEYHDTLTGALLRLAPLMREKVREAVEAGGEVIRQRAYDLANVSPTVAGHAVDGSHMRDNIEVGIRESPNGVEARIGIDMGIVPYAAHQEFGDRGKPFLRPAIDESRAEVHEIMRSVIFEGAEATTLVRFRRIA